MQLSHLQELAKQLGPQGRWAANLAASMLLSQAIALQPVHAGDAVNYSDFMDSVNRGGISRAKWIS